MAHIYEMKIKRLELVIEGLEDSHSGIDYNHFAKDIATEFYYHWHDSGDTNTAAGFDDWWVLNKDRFGC